VTEPRLPTSDALLSLIADHVRAELASALGADDLHEILTAVRLLVAEAARHGARGKPLSVAEVAERVGRDQQAVRRAIDRGDLVAFRVCGRLIVYESDFEKWLDRCRVEPKIRARRSGDRPNRITRPVATNGLRRLLVKGPQGA
jgi:excisionase family DNA binding protein